MKIKNLLLPFLILLSSCPYFSSDYTIEPWESLSPSGKSLAFYLDAYGNEGDWKVAFFDNTLAPYSQRSQLISPLVSGIYSKGKWSYALTSFQDGKRIFDQLLVSMKKQMYAVVHASSFPYDVYYDADTLYLINQDPAFSEDYFAKFKAAQGKIYRLK
jgi:hypothetical protein